MVRYIETHFVVQVVLNMIFGVRSEIVCADHEVPLFRPQVLFREWPLIG
jgi:hypothetical protein